MGFHQLCLASVIMMIILLKPIAVGDASLLWKSNATYGCNGLLKNCRITEELEWEMDFSMTESNVNRILQQGNVHPVTPNALDGKHSIVQKPCHPYTKCLTGSNGKGGEHKGKPPPCRDIYDCKGQLAHES